MRSLTTRPFCTWDVQYQIKSRIFFLFKKGAWVGNNSFKFQCSVGSFLCLQRGEGGKESFF